MRKDKAARPGPGAGTGGDRAPDPKTDPEADPATPAEGSASGAGDDVGGGGAEMNGGIGAQGGPLSRDRIVTAAIGLIDRFGPAQLTMRRLAADLGYEAMSLYRYVPSRDELIDAVVSEVIDVPLADPDLAPSSAVSWQDFLARLAIGVRDAAIAHPRVFPLVASRPSAASWLRPPLRSVAWVETFIAGLVDRGFSDRAAVTAYRSYTSFLLGHLLLEVNELTGDAAPVPRPEPDELTGERLEAEYPHLARVADQLRENDSEAEFADALDHLLVRLELLLPGMAGEEREGIPEP